MSEPRRRPRPPDDELPEELRALIEKARPPAPIDRETRARLRRRLAAATGGRPGLAKARRWRDRAVAVALVAAAALFLWWIAGARGAGPIALPVPDPDMEPPPAPPAHNMNPERSPERSGDGGPDGGGPDGGGARWYPVQNRCTGAVCARDPACCSGPWDERCDDLLMDAARLTDRLSGGVGRCYYHDREICPDCACEYYLKVGDAKANAAGFDGGTGCLRSREALLATLKGQCATAVCE